MKNRSWLSLVFLLTIACSEQQLNPETQTDTVVANSEKSLSASNARTESGINCDEMDSFSLLVNDVEVGTGKVSLADSGVVVSYDLLLTDWYLVEAGVFVGDCNNIPSTASAYPYFDEFDEASDGETNTHEIVASLEGVPHCGCISIMALVGRYNPTTSSFESARVMIEMEYCDCEEPEEPDEENLRTQTPGGWGARPRGNNPGAYLHANFEDAFSSGLTVGCDYTLTFTSAQAITDYLPVGGTPAALTMSYVDPTSNPKTVLAGHVVALKLSVTFDAWDADFGDSNTELADAVVVSGDFAGWTVAEVLAEAEKVLGGCASDYSASALVNVLSSINENFVDGTTNNGFLMNGN